jgi:carbonic anhydrase
MPERRKPLLAPRPDFGLSALRPAWREAYQRATLRDDALAGFASLGPSFALALFAAQHAGLSEAAALACAVVGSAIVALGGGTKLGLSGPGLAMSVALVHVARDHGAVGLAIAGALCGLVQLLLGLIGVGRFSRLLPETAVHAFVFGLGALLIVQSLPTALGLALPKDLDVPHVLDHVGAHLGGTRWAAVGMAVFCGAATWLGSRRMRRAPVALLAIAVCAAVTWGARLDVPTLPDLPLALPLWPTIGVPAKDVAQLLQSAFVLFALASLETLLSGSAEEKRVPGVHGDPDQDLIGHGIANLLLSPFGGVPVAGSIARSSALRASGGRTRAAAAFHALFGAALIVLVLVFDRLIPLAALAGVVIAVAVPLLDHRPLRAAYRVSRSEALVLVGTVFVILGGDLLRGLEVGLLATLVLAMLRIARFRTQIHRGQDGAPHQVSFSGPITFLSVPEIEATSVQLAALDPATAVILDVRSVLVMDLTGCERFVSLVLDILDRGGKVAVLGASPSIRDNLLAADRRGVLAARLCVTDRDVDKVLGQARAFEMRAQVVANLDRFRHELREHYTPLFDQLAEGQHPHTLFVTCVDSRITPSMLTGSHPGELFILRCLGAMVPPPEGDTRPAEGAAVEYAVGVLDVRNIVICGHSRCGAVKAAKSGHVPDELPTLQRWLDEVPASCGDLSGHEDADDAARAVAVRQLENLRQFPLVRERCEAGKLKLFAWFYDVAQAELFEWNEETKSFAVLAGHRLSEAPPV